MRCKKHLTDLSSSVGVCASCLRERLLALIAAQTHALAQAHQAQLAQAALDDRRNSDPPPLLFPRSVSPYVSRRKSDGSAVSWSQHHHHHFYSTPQVGPSCSSSVTTTTTTTTTDFGPSRVFNKKKGKLSLISNLFRSRSDKLNLDPKVAPPDSYEDPSSSPSSSWFSTIFSIRRKKQQSKMFYMEESSAGHRRSGRVVDRGMSPVRRENTEDEGGDRSPYGSSSEASPRWRRTPGATRRGKGRNMSGLAFCLSPLVRASPNRHWNQKGGLPPEIGEVRAPVKPCPAAAAPFCKSRSRKLADFGRVNPNR